MMQDVEINQSSNLHDIRNSNPDRYLVVGGFHFRRRTALLVGTVLVLLLVVVIPVAVLVPKSGSGSGSSQGKLVGPDDQPDPELYQLLLDEYQSRDVSSTPLTFTGTPQYKAYLWLTENTNLSFYGRATKIQRFALASFYYSTFQVQTLYTQDNPPEWKDRTGWLSDFDECASWFGVVCNGSNQVTGLKMQDNDLTGKLPFELAFLPRLHDLDLTTNLLFMEGAELDVFGTLLGLRTLMVDDNFLTYDNGLPPGFALLTDLEVMRLSYNLFEGQIDGSIFSNLRQLTHIEIESNFLQGDFPAEIAQLEKLVYLYMRRNALRFNLDWMKNANLPNLCKSF